MLLHLWQQVAGPINTLLAAVPWLQHAGTRALYVPQGLSAGHRATPREQQQQQ